MSPLPAFPSTDPHPAPWLQTPTCPCSRYTELSRSVIPKSLRPHGLQPTRLLCPWDFPGKNTGVGCRFCLQGIFRTQGWNSYLLHWQAGSLSLRNCGGTSYLSHEKAVFYSNTLRSKCLTCVKSNEIFSTSFLNINGQPALPDIWEESPTRSEAIKKEFKRTEKMLGVGWVEGIERKKMRIVDGHSRKPNFYHIFQKKE